MKTRADKSQKSQSKALANGFPQKERGSNASFEFMNNRPEAIAQRELQRIANDGPQVKQLKIIQEEINNSPQSRPISQLTEQSHNHASETVQLYNGVDEGLEDYYEQQEAEEDFEEEYYSDDEVRWNWVRSNWDASSAWDSAIAVATPAQAWDYTATFQWTLRLETVRAHVHYYDNHNGTYTKAPGNYWISGLHGFSVQTPNSVVNNAPADPTTI